MFEIRTKGKLIQISEEELMKIVGEVHKVVEESAKGLEKTARSYAPVVTGRLRSSIRSEEVERTRETIRFRVKAGGDQAPYAPFVEFGTGRRGREGITPEGLKLAEAHGYRHGVKKGTTPRLFMTRAYVLWSEAMEREIGKVIDEAVKRLTG